MKVIEEVQTTVTASNYATVEDVVEFLRSRGYWYAFYGMMIVSRPLPLKGRSIEWSESFMRDVFKGCSPEDAIRVLCSYVRNVFENAEEFGIRPWHEELEWWYAIFSRCTRWNDDGGYDELKRDLSKDWASWLKENEIKGFILNTP